MDAVDEALIDHLTENVLTESVITAALKLLRRRLIDRTRSTSADLKPLEAEAKRLRTEIDNLVSAIAGRADKPDAIVQAVAERQEKLSALDARIRAMKSAPEAIATELSRLEREARGHLTDLRKTLRAHPVEARAFLSRLFAGPLKFTPEGNRYRIEGEIPVAAALFGGVPKSVSPGGFEGRTFSAENAADRSEPREGSSVLETTADVPRTDPDDALKQAIKVALDAGQLDRVAKLLEVLRSTASTASVVDLATRRRT